MRTGLPDTHAYYNIPAFRAGFPASLALGPRVLKQNRGSQVIASSAAPIQQNSRRSAFFSALSQNNTRHRETEGTRDRLSCALWINQFFLGIMLSPPRPLHDGLHAGLQGEGIWICRLQDESLYRTRAALPMDTVVHLTEVGPAGAAR